jgi:conjugative relaxase-like TrwC/TraI family protein
MISIGAVSSASGAAGYYARDNYYTEGEGADRSQWHGRGAEALGLAGAVATSAFEAVLEGHLPNGASITTPSGQEHRPGLDMAFSAPKSVSLMALVGGDERLLAAFEASVMATLGWVERNLIEARRFNEKSGTQQPVKTGNMVAALFTHDLSRNRDPQLHVHAVIANATQRPDGEWRAVRNDPLYGQQATIAAVHNADLRERIEGLGYRTVPAHNPVLGQFEIAGISREHIMAFSTRREEIAAALEASGREGSAAERELAALATRAAKDPGISREEDRAAWAGRAVRIGFDPAPLREAALVQMDRGDTIWGRVVDGLKGMAAKGQAIVAAMGLSPREKDPLVPERSGRLSPQDFAAAQAVASGVRHLSQNEAGFSRFDLIRTSLSFGGPIGVGDIEARIETLAERGALLTDPDGAMMTTSGAVALEREVIALWAQGKDQAAPLVEDLAGPKVQQVAREMGLRRLSPKQEAAASLILEAKDRIVGVQGVAGAGKSTMLQPVTAIAGEQGRNVVALAVGAEIARKLGTDLGVPSASVAAFLGRHKALLREDGAPALKERSLEQLRGAVVIVDEASTLSSSQAADLMRLAHRADVARLALVGDTRQYGSVESGKPFEDLQRRGLATAELTQNVRAQSGIMKQLVPVLNGSDMHTAVGLLNPFIHEVPKGQLASHAVAVWASLPREEREQTLLLTSGRALRAEANREAQAVLKARGEISEQGVSIPILDRVNLSREEVRHMQPYRVGRMVEIRTSMPRQGLGKGTLGRIAGVEDDKVILDIDRGRITFVPSRVARNLGEDAVGLYEERRIALHQGDSIRFSANNHALGVLNAQVGKVEALDATMITIAIGQDRRLNLALDDPALRRLDLAYALNAYAAQGVTTRHGIVVMDSSEVMLASSRTLAVALTRIADQPRLVIDSAHRLEQAVTRNSGAKLSALDILKNPVAVHLPEAVREPIPGRQIKPSDQVERDQQRLSQDTLRIPHDMRRAIEASLPVVQIQNLPEKSLDLSL